MSYLILDVASCAIDGVKGFIQEPAAPSNYKDPAKIAAYIAEAKSELEQKAGLDIDLARISAIGSLSEDGNAPLVELCKTEDEERQALSRLIPSLHSRNTLVGFNSAKFDWPLIMRRCLYLGLIQPSINLDRYRSPHLDLWNLLSFNGAVQAHSLTWYVKRLGWSDLVKPLSGAQEAQAPANGQWEELRASVAHDLEATRRLAVWAGVLPKQAIDAGQP